MKIVFRVDSSTMIGSGHVMRCLTLADELRSRGASTLFISRQLDGHLGDTISRRGHRLCLLPKPLQWGSGYGSELTGYACWLGIDWETDAAQTREVLQQEHDITWLVVDSYSLDARWELKNRLAVKRIMVVDDLADRPHDADLLLDQNLFRDMPFRYQGLLPAGSQSLLGPDYALLRPEFVSARKTLRQRDGSVARILVFFGSSDLSNETLKTLNAIKLLSRPDIAVVVVLGINHPNRREIEEFTVSMANVSCHFNISNMAELMAAADLYIGAAGTTTWERCCLGLPSLVITVAQNQVYATKELSEAGVLCFVGEHDVVSDVMIAASAATFLDNPMLLKKYSEASLMLVDGLGSARCAEILMQSK